MSAAAFLALLEDGDVKALRGAWAKVAPHLPQPKTFEQAEIVMHYSRTQQERITFKKRAYSHAWLCERGLPSGLPDRLKPSAERIYPHIALAVGISVNVRNPVLQPVATEVRHSMENAVLEAEADGKLADAPFVKARMMEARNKTYQQLLGTTGMSR